MSAPLDQSEVDRERHTRLIFVGNRLFLSPLEALYSLLIFILCKDLGATPLQVALLVSFKPLSALISFYSHLYIKGRSYRLKRLIMLAEGARALPSLLFPFVESSSFYVASFVLFMMAGRAMLPAWSEILKINLPQERRASIFSLGSSASYLLNAFIPLAVAPWIDLYPFSWRWLFFAFSILQLFSLTLVSRLKLKSLETPPGLAAALPHASLGALFLQPWREGLKLLRERPDFLRFQIVFMLGGSGLMVIQPLLPLFFNEVLKLSYTAMSFATILAKGVAFALSSPFWASLFSRLSLHLFNLLVTLFAALFPLSILLSSYHLGWLYFAYFIYGVMQAGSEMSWNLSGPIFAKERESTLFSSVNVAMVGIRGAFAPFLGELLFIQTTPFVVFTLGSLLCLLASALSFSLYQEERRGGVLSS